MKELVAAIVCVAMVLGLGLTIDAQGQAQRSGRLYVEFEDGREIIVPDSHHSAALHFEFAEASGRVSRAYVILESGEHISWKGQGGEYADFSDCKTAYWHWVLTPSNILTISEGRCIEGYNGEEEENGSDDNGSNGSNGDSSYNHDTNNNSGNNGNDVSNDIGGSGTDINSDANGKNDVSVNLPKDQDEEVPDLVEAIEEEEETVPDLPFTS